jgi:hypothetical protein
MLKGELEHKRVKGFYPFSKTKDHASTIAMHQRRQQKLHKISLRDTTAACKERIAQLKAGINRLGRMPSSAFGCDRRTRKKNGRPQ